MAQWCSCCVGVCSVLPYSDPLSASCPLQPTSPICLVTRCVCGWVGGCGWVWVWVCPCLVLLASVISFPLGAFSPPSPLPLTSPFCCTSSLSPAPFLFPSPPPPHSPPLTEWLGSVLSFRSFIFGSLYVLTLSLSCIIYSLTLTGNVQYVCPQSYLHRVHAQQHNHSVATWVYKSCGVPGCTVELLIPEINEQDTFSCPKHPVCLHYNP